jgi:hypothetical protein
MRGAQTMEARQPMHTDSLPTGLLPAALGLLGAVIVLTMAPAAGVSTSRDQ